MMRLRKQSPAGFTLLEVLLALAQVVLEVPPMYLLLPPKPLLCLLRPPKWSLTYVSM